MCELNSGIFSPFSLLLKGLIECVLISSLTLLQHLFMVAQIYSPKREYSVESASRVTEAVAIPREETGGLATADLPLVIESE